MTGEQPRVPERVIAHVRPHARALALPSILLIAACGGAAYGVTALDEEWQRLAALVGAALVVVLLFLLPLVRWLGTHYLITTRRVVLRTGLIARTRQELLHGRIYDVRLRQTPLQRLFRSGDVLINTGLDTPVVLRDAPRALLVQEALGDLMEASTSSVAAQRRQTAATSVIPPDGRPRGR